MSMVIRAPVGKEMSFLVPAANSMLPFDIKHSLKKTYTHL